MGYGSRDWHFWFFVVCFCNIFNQLTHEPYIYTSLYLQQIILPQTAHLPEHLQLLFSWMVNYYDLARMINGIMLHWLQYTVCWNFISTDIFESLSSKKVLFCNKVYMRSAKMKQKTPLLLFKQVACTDVFKSIVGHAHRKTPK